MERTKFDPLFNCTMQLLEFEEFVNVTANFNHTSVSEFLRNVFGGKNVILSPEIKHKAVEFISTCILPPRPYDLIWWQKLVWTAVFAVMLLIATGGNLIVMWIVLAHRNMRTVTNYFLVNLSVSDLLMSVLNCICNFIFMLNANWPFGTIYCSFNNFVSSVTVAAGVFTLMAISFDRYMAIVKPLQHRMSHRRARIVLVIIWVASGLLAIPPLLYSTTMTKRYADGQTRIICYMLWPDGAYPTSKTDYMYNLIFLGVTYLMPMIVMAVCYSLMGRELWGSRSIGELTQRQIDSVKSKRKVVRMFIIVVLIFVFCWLPYHGYFIYAYHNNAMAGSAYVQHVFLSFYWLAMSNAMVNPIIYYWMNARFRVYFQRVLCCCFRRKYRKEYPMMRKVGRNSSHSEMGRSRVELFAKGSRKFASIKWPNQMQELGLKEIGGKLPKEAGAQVHALRNAEQAVNGNTELSDIFLFTTATRTFLPLRGAAVGTTAMSVWSPTARQKAADTGAEAEHGEGKNNGRPSGRSLCRPLRGESRTKSRVG